MVKLALLVCLVAATVTAAHPGLASGLRPALRFKAQVRNADKCFKRGVWPGSVEVKAQDAEAKCCAGRSPPEYYSQQHGGCSSTALDDSGNNKNPEVEEDEDDSTLFDTFTKDDKLRQEQTFRVTPTHVGDKEGPHSGTCM